MTRKLLLCAIALVFLCGCIVRPLQELTYEQSEPGSELRYLLLDPEGVYLSTLREDYRLLSRIAGAATDLQRTALLSAWVSGLWVHDPEGIPLRNDPLSILWEAAEGGRFRSPEYAQVLSGALQAVAIPVRFITMHELHIEQTVTSHVVCEAYMRDLQKWVMVDPRWNRIPLYGGKPLSAYEFQQYMISDPRGITYYQQERDIRYTRWIRNYLYYLHTNQDCRLNTESYAYKNLMLVPANLPVPRFYSPYHRELGYLLSENTSVTRDPYYFNARPVILFDQEAPDPLQ